MLYGSTARHAYSQYSPAPVWGLWKSFGIQDSEMIGYWDENSPVKTNCQNVKVTSYVKNGKTLIAIGNFGKKDENIQLVIDWESLGLNPENATIMAPDIEDFQKERIYETDHEFTIESKKGLLLILEEEKGS